MMGRTVFLAVAASLLCPLASASIVLIEEPGPEGMLIGVEQDVSFRTTFEFEEPGEVYFKILAVPWNPVNDGSPNGTVEDGEGVDGWWVHFELLAGNGRPLTQDNDGDPVDPDLGDHVSTNGTRKVAINGSTTYIIETTVHVPSEAAEGEGTYEVPFAIVQAGPDGGTGSGAAKEPSQGVVLELVRPQGDTEPGSTEDQENGVAGSGSTAEGGGGEEGSNAGEGDREGFRLVFAPTSESGLPWWVLPTAGAVAIVFGVGGFLLARRRSRMKTR